MTPLPCLPQLDLSSLSPEVRQARQFAIDAHGDQPYGSWPYHVHLDDVVALAQSQGCDDTTLILLYLHDVVEDTVVDEAGIARVFGDAMAELVRLITDEDGATREEAKPKTNAKHAQISASDPLRVRVLAAKVTDRLCNVSRCVMDNHTRLLETYIDEHPAFRAAVYREGVMPALWAQLDALIDAGVARGS